MKLKLLILLITFLSGVELNCQLLPGDVKSSIKPHNRADGIAGAYYAGVSFKSANTINNWGLDLGVQAGGMISDHFGLGASFYTLFTQNIRILANQPYFLRLSYGGIEPQFVFKFGNIAFHTKALIALGFAGYSESVNFDILSDLDGDWIFMTEPSFGISYIIDESLWLTFDGGWRVVGGVDFKNIKAEDLGGPMIGLTLKTLMF